MRRIAIREHRMGDLEAYADWQMDPECARHVAWLPKSRAECERGLRDAISQQDATPRLRYFFAVVEAASDEVVGDTGFTVVAPGVADCGWFIRRKFWNQGFGAEAARLLVEYAFARTDVRRLTAACAVDNAASAKIMQRCGFTLVRKTGGRVHYEIGRGVK